METIKNCLAILLSLVATSVLGGPAWNTLKVKWPISTGIPTTTEQAKSYGYNQVYNLCGDYRPYAKWRGYVYYHTGHGADVIPLFDKNGYIAGIQTAIEAPDIGKYPGNQKMFIKDGLKYYLTAYFVHPSRICEGRTAEEFAKEGTGTDLYIQTGPDPEKDIMKVPRQQNDIVNQPSWVLGKCFRTMGVHYWYNLSEDMDCDNFFPVFLLYNRNVLTGFGWAMMLNREGDLYEHPPASVFGQFMQKVPKCSQNRQVTTQHIYFADYNFC